MPGPLALNCPRNQDAALPANPNGDRLDPSRAPRRPERRLAQRVGAAWGCLTAGDLAGALFAQRAQVDGGPGAVGPPRLRDFGEGAACAVPFGDLGLEAAFVAG